MGTIFINKNLSMSEQKCLSPTKENLSPSKARVQ